jgi:hypothetical protein
MEVHLKKKQHLKPVLFEKVNITCKVKHENLVKVLPGCVHADLHTFTFVADPQCCLLPPVHLLQCLGVSS